jgi:WhiB family redox-sensing transcriptional regulator
MSHVGVAKLARPHPRTTETDLVWRGDAACRDHLTPDDFFSDNEQKGRQLARRAITICQGCPVRTQCLLEALDNDQQWGIWGGLSARERQKLKRT